MRPWKLDVLAITRMSMGRRRLAIKCFRRRSRQERASGWMHRQRHQRSAVALEPSRQFELEQNHVHSGR
jgi:hypothetical protein